MSTNIKPLNRMVSLRQVASCAVSINIGAILAHALWGVSVETLAAALYWPWITFLIVTIASSGKKAQ